MSKPESNGEDLSSTWKHRLEEDGWYRAHNALRADMTAVESMLASFRKQLAAGTPISREQAAAATRFVVAFVKFLHHHHANEDAIASPYLSTRFQLNDKIGADHKHLEELMQSFEAGIKKMLAATQLDEQQKLLLDVTATFEQMHSLCLEHFREEEAEAMPLMRRHFTPKEIEKNVVSKILRGMGPDDVGAYFRTMSKEEFRGFAKQEGIPFFICWILGYQVRKYRNNVWTPFEQRCLSAAA